MFKEQVLEDHLLNSSTIKTNSLVIGEWNMNFIDNIAQIGNYRYRPNDPTTSKYFSILDNFDANDEGNFYTNATDADIIIDGGVKDDGTPQLFKSKKEKESLLYSLEDCLGRFRPRSGINKARYLNGYLHFPNAEMANRPRYYMASKDDQFKYWTSYRTEDGVERGIANQEINGQYYISDAVPFVIYKNPVPANKIVVKMQTHVGTVDLGPFENSYTSFNDPFFGEENQSTPVSWKIQYLENGGWINALSFNQFSLRTDGTPIVGPDGYVEVSYGLIVPEQYLDIFVNAGKISAVQFLPEENSLGYAYLVGQNNSNIGKFYIWTGEKYETFDPEFGWYLSADEVNARTSLLTEFVSPVEYQDGSSGFSLYSEFKYISGIRVVVETMNKFESTFDLIEMSPRLTADLSDRTLGFNITKTASDLGISGLPVGQLLASTGSISFFDFDQAFNLNNQNSIISKYSAKNLQIKLYEKINDVDGKDYFVPIKTMYAEGFPETDNTQKEISLNLRDLFFYFESISAPQILIQEASLSSAIALLLDSVGYSNYIFKRVEGESDPIIPYFFVEPDTSVAEVLNRIARSTQATMFFDEYNNFVLMSKDYILPTLEQRPTDIVLNGTKDYQKTGPYKNSKIEQGKTGNILDLSYQSNDVYNDGSINYTTRYIQRALGSIKQASLIDRDQSWIYKSTLLWEISPSLQTRSQNEELGNQSAYTLAAIPLNSNLSSDTPSVVNNQIINNVIDLGEAVWWITRYNGYFYSNGEIIKFDAVQYNVSGILGEDGSGNVWITSVQEYQNYFSKLSFNGKIYATGLVRIYAEPNYVTINEETLLQNGAVAKHGRGQFGTSIVSHNAGLDGYWSNNENVRGCVMNYSYLVNGFGSDKIINAEAKTPNNALPYIEYETLGNSGLVVGDFINITGIKPEAYNGNSLRVSSVSNNTNENKYTFRVNKTFIAASIDRNNRAGDSSTKFVSGGQAEKLLPIESGPSGVRVGDVFSNDIAKQTQRNGIIKNFLSSSDIRDTEVGNLFATQTGTTQSSALIMNGPPLSTIQNPIEFISYVYKPLNDSFKHFGTRMRIIGKIENNSDRGQTPVGSSPYYSVSGTSPDQSTVIGGASGGLSVMVNPETNVGYYFEIAALTENNVKSFDDSENIYNVLFYKIQKEKNKENERAIPIRLYGGLAKIIVDSGTFAGQARIVGEENPTVYDLAVEYEDIGSTRRFYLYINNKIVAVVDDENPIPKYNNMALFVRGSSKVMFENIYALANNYSQSSAFTLDTPFNSVFDDKEIDTNEAFRKYSLSGIIQSTYLSGVSPSEPPKYNMYFEEFGTIMREASYLNIRYDKAYPALYSKISNTFNLIKGYTVSGFLAGSYGAEFLIFNSTDTALNLDETSGNYLRIQGIAFTQSSTNQLTVDEYFNKKSDFSDPEYATGVLISSPNQFKEQYQDIKNSRRTYGKKEFSIDSPYIQSFDAANELMGWITKKIIKPRLAVGMNVFGLPIVQLGDIVSINYKENNIDMVLSEDKRFVVYNIEYSNEGEGPSMTIYLSEVS